MAIGINTTGSLPKGLWPGVNAFWGMSYNEHEHLYRMLYDMKTSDKKYEEDVEIRGFGLAPHKPEGTSVQYDTWRQGDITRYQHVPYALGFIVSDEEIRDNQYEDVINQRVPRLAFSMKTTREIVGANIYNRAFDATQQGADGQALLSTTHRTDDGNQSNRLAIDADLSETALEDLAIQIMDAEDARGLRINIRPRSLIVPTSLQYVADRILMSTLQNDTANNAVNALARRGDYPEGYVVNTYLTDPDAWFVRTDIQNGMCWYDRDETMFAEDNDFDRTVMKFKAYMRFSAGWSDWRGLYGSPGS